MDALNEQPPQRRNSLASIGGNCINRLRSNEDVVSDKVAVHEADNDSALPFHANDQNAIGNGNFILMLLLPNIPEYSISRGVLRMFTEYGSTSPH